MEGKKKYFALVLFLFLGLMIFTFANPSEEEKEFIDGDSNQSEKVENNKDKLAEQKPVEQEETTTGQQNNLNNVTNNTNNNNDNTQNREEDYLGKALAAVEKAEVSYTKEDVEAAKQLVNNVTDATEKGKLQNRLEEVEAGITVLELVEKLEEQVEEATAKTDMTEAKDFRDENEIAEKIEALTNENVAEELQKRLDEVSKLLDDNKAPIINVEEKAYPENVTVSAEDEEGNNFKLYLTKDSAEEKEIENNTLTTSEGIYIARAIDEAFNESDPVRFIVDWTEPVFKDLTNGGHYKDVTINVEDLSEVVIKVTNMDKAETTEIENGTKLTDEATYKLEATDEALNKTTYYVAIDKTKPAISTTDKSIINYTKWTEVTDKFLTLVKIKYEDLNGEITEENFTRADFEVGARNENFKFRYKLEEEGKYTIYAEDKYGNYKEETVTVDKTAAVRKSTDFYVHSLTAYNKVFYTQYGNKLTLNITTDEPLKEIPTFTLHNNGKDFVMTDVLDRGLNDKGYYLYQASLVITEESGIKDGEITFTISNILDKAGNKTEDITNTTNCRRIIVDNVKPEFIVKDTSIGYDPYFNNVSYKLFDAVLLNKYVINGIEKTFTPNNWSDANYENIKQYLIEGKNTITLYDMAGNETTKEFYMDWTVGTTKSADYYVNGAIEYDGIFYATNGKTVVANIATNEELGENPTFTFYNNDKAYPADEVLATGYDAENDKYYYQATLTIKTDKDFTDGELTYIVTNIVDRGGNKIVDVNGPSNGRKVYIDKTAPQLNVKSSSIENGNGYKQLDLQAIDNHMSHVIINGNKHERTAQYVDINHGHMQTYLVGENTITAVDKAGNETTKTFIIDYDKYIYTEEELHAAVLEGGNYKFGADIAITKTVTIPSGISVELDMNEKKLTFDDSFSKASSKFSDYSVMIDMKENSSLTLKGNGTFDLEDNYNDVFIIPRGDLTIENGTFLKNAGGPKYQSFFAGVVNGKGKMIIKDGYFDFGEYSDSLYYNAANGLNLSYGQIITIYGGTFVGQNPAYGDESSAATSPTPNLEHCQGTFFEGQKVTDTTIPSTYQVIEGTHEDGRPIYKVIYTPAE